MSFIHEGARTPLDDCPPYDPTQWQGKDCFYLTKLLETREIRDVLYEKAVGGDLNPILNGRTELTVRPRRRHRRLFGMLRARAPGQELEPYLSPAPPTLLQQVNEILTTLLNYVGFANPFANAVAPTSSTSILHPQYQPQVTTYRHRLRNLFVGLGVLDPDVEMYANTVPPVFAVTPTDNLHERLNIALEVGDTLAAAQIAAELARRRASIQGKGDQPELTVRVQAPIAAAKDFWRK